uniref:Uncharacterized protein n=1 Tax=Avena sativa TaxID=4498 RepID=A0ACD5UPE1_AVESA
MEAYGTGGGGGFDPFPRVSYLRHQEASSPAAEPTKTEAMATASTTPFPRLLAPARSNPAARPSLSLRGSPKLSSSRSIISVRRRLAAASKDTASDKEQEQEPSTAAGGAAKPAEETPASGEKTQEEVAAELKEVMRARKDAEVASGGGGWWAGVTQEMSEIDWPAPGKVLGTTGVVLGIIAGSTAALLSVNAILAELSDQFFAGRGIQDFF